MHPAGHLISGILFAFIVLLNFPHSRFWGFSLIIFSTLFVDADHYLFYLAKKKNLNLKRAFNWFVKFTEKRKVLSPKERKKYKHIILIFHGIEFWAILILFSAFYKIGIYVFAGVMFHMLLDAAELTYTKMGFSCILSQTYNLFYNRNRKNLLD